MNAQRLFVIVLVVIAVLFVISLAAGSSHGNQPPDNASIVSALKGLRSPPLGSFDDHDRATCATGQTTLLVGASPCVITLDKRSFFSRPIRVILLSPSTNTTDAAVAVQPNSGAALEATLKPGNCFDTAVSHSGGTITINSGSPVALSLARSC